MNFYSGAALSPHCADTRGSGWSTLISCGHSTGWRLSFSRRLQSREGKAGAGLHVAGPRHHQGATDSKQAPHSSNYWKYMQLDLNILQKLCIIKSKICSISTKLSKIQVQKVFSRAARNLDPLGLSKALCNNCDLMP